MKGMAVLLVALTALLAWAILALVENERKWEQFKVDHQCKVVAHIRGDVFNTVGFDGSGNVSVGIGSTPDKTGWLCDDGMTYYR